MNKNKVNKTCKYFNDDAKCALIQPEQNCYQCIMVEQETNKKDMSLMREKLRKLEEENRTLKILLADNAIESYKTSLKPEVNSSSKDKEDNSKRKIRMFSSAQMFTINGCEDDDLEKVLELALELSGWGEVESFYEDKNGLVLCAYECECDGSKVYPTTPTIPMLVEQINQYIKSLPQEDIIRVAGNRPSIDGIVELGWEVFHPLSYGKNKVENYELAGIIGVRPCWIIFSK